MYLPYSPESVKEEEETKPTPPSENDSNDIPKPKKKSKYDDKHITIHASAKPFVIIKKSKKSPHLHLAATQSVLRNK